MIIDIHSHIFSHKVRDDRSAHFHGEPAFQMIYDSPKAHLSDAEETIAMMDAQGVDKSVVFGFPWRNPAFFKRENDDILESVAKYPDRLIGFACFDAAHPDAAKETERCLDAGLCGVGELAFYETGIDEACRDALEPVMAVCRERDVPVLIHTNEPVGHVYPGKSPNTLAQIYALVRRYPDNRIILAHWGGGIFFYELLKREASEVLANVWYDTAASPFLYHASVYRTACDLAGVDKVLFGTDYPLLKPSRYFREMEDAGLLPAEKAAITGGNAAALLKLA